MFMEVAQPRVMELLEYSTKNEFYTMQDSSRFSRNVSLTVAVTKAKKDLDWNEPFTWQRRTPGPAERKPQRKNVLGDFKNKSNDTQLFVLQS
jgi:hypothetical protein